MCVGFAWHCVLVRVQEAFGRVLAASGVRVGVRVDKKQVYSAPRLTETDLRCYSHLRSEQLYDPIFESHERLTALDMDSPVWHLDNGENLSCEDGCNACGRNLEAASKISRGWYCIAEGKVWPFRPPAPAELVRTAGAGGHGTTLKFELDARLGWTGPGASISGVRLKRATTTMSVPKSG